MKKMMMIIRHEYTRHVLRKRFIFALLSVPLWIFLSVGAGVLSVLLQSDPTPVGYVDYSGVLDGVDFSAVATDEIRPARYLPFQSETAAQEALEKKEIQAFFVLPTSYRETLDVELRYLDEPNQMIRTQFADALRVGLLKDQDPIITQRILDGPQLVIQATREDRGMAENEWFKIAAPIAAGIFLVVSVFTSGGYLMQAVVEEKENRTIEIMATSLSPMQIMGGKIIGLIGVGLTQVVVWGIFPMVVVLLARPFVPFLRDISIDWNVIILVILTAVPTFLLVSALMATIGATVTEAREGQQVSSLITLPVMAPFILTTMLVSNPNGIIAVALSFFPLTAALTLLLRMAFATVPTWQVVLSTAILIVSAFGSLWLAGRVFRIGMLRYGKRLGWREVIQAITLRSTRIQEG